MSNVIQLSNTQRGFTRMDNELYEALIASNLSLKELRVAMAVHRLTAGYNREVVKVAALYISKMLYGDESKADAERANVSRAINSLIRQRVLYRAGGSRDPISFMAPHEWKVASKSTVLKSTHCVETY
jgi:phage replication O-like protein O